ncbi:DUF4142 domain-containing protein [Sphingobium sp. EP60837]|uniref:DUF4142 domain-containing protein n=1 Tax=Sphingobium sp. EP60837 TaxID=1855519 RepID=UPI0007DD2F80|nr:DUF4142 domain-containing protein [Sphingobium sp. EP60837]ANI79070.1 hypothetical protein EP837_02675 [Sphingobium sp. EP60837]
MNRKPTLLAVVLAAAALASCGRQPEPTANQSSAGATNGLSAIEQTPAQPSAGQAFADAAAASDMFEIESSKLAKTNAASTAVKRFAQSMIKAHMDSTTKLVEAAGQAAPSIAPKVVLSANQQQVLDGLKLKKGAEFDAAYIATQREAHQATLEELKAYSSNGDVPSLKAFATALVPIVTGHLNMANGLEI